MVRQGERLVAASDPIVRRDEPPSLMQNMVSAIIPIVLIAVLFAAVVTDIRLHKISNWLTLPATGLGLLLNALPGGHGLLFSIGGLGAASLSIPIFLVSGALRAGDVKLLWAVGALMGPGFTFWSLLCMAIAGGVLALGYAARHGVAVSAVRTIMTGMQVLATTGSTDALAAVASVSKAGKMPYAPAIALGVAASAILRHLGVFR